MRNANFRRLFIIVFIIGFSFNIAGLTYAAEEKGALKSEKPPAPAVAGEKPLQQRAPARAPARPNFAVVLGSISKIDNKDPAKPRIEVKSDADNKIHAIEITPWTSVTKMTDLSELKAGDTVRVMTRKVEDNEVAMNVLFGKIKNLPGLRPPRQGAASQTQGAVEMQPQPKKEAPKK